MSRFIILVVLLSLSGTLSGRDLENQGLKTFTTDGCTLFIDGPPRQSQLWRHCCVEHDLRYWFGGSLNDRDTADLRLRSCVEKAASKTWADIIYWGVKTGQHSPIKFSHRWSWGWIISRQMNPLTPEESHIAIEELRRLPIDQSIIERFIEVNFPSFNE